MIFYIWSANGNFLPVSVNVFSIIKYIFKGISSITWIMLNDDNDDDEVTWLGFVS